MIKKSVLTSLFIGLFISNNCFASFEYSGVFPPMRQSNEPQTYYILLNENTKVSLNLKDENGNDCKNVFVSQIKLSSDETKLIKSDTGIIDYSVPITGIYEVEVKSNADLSEAVSYTLKVDEETLQSSLTENTAESISKKETFSEINLKQSDKIATSSNLLVPDISDPIAAPNTLVTTVNTEQTIASDAVDTEQIEDAKTFMVTSESLSPDTIAVEESENKNTLNNEQIASGSNEITLKNSFVENIKVNFDGKLELIKSIDVFDFISDKSKCWPKSVCVDDNNCIYVLDGQLNKIHCYDSNYSEIRAFGSKGKENFALGIPVSIATFQGKILVGDRQKHCIHIYDSNGNWLTAIQSNQNTGLRINNPVSICIRNNEIWVGDSGTNRILCFDSSFAFLGSFGSTNENKIESIAAISTDGNCIYILEEEGCIKRFGPMGNFEAAFATEINFGSSIFIDNEKNIWVVDTEKGLISCFANEGSLRYSLNKEKLNGLFNNSDRFAPSDIVINNSAKIIVTDTALKQVQIFDLK